MLNNDKIQLMTKLALFEQKHGKKAFASSKYYKSDYIGLGLVNSAIIATLVFILTIACSIFVNIEKFLEDITGMDLLKVGRITVIVYILYMIVYLTIAYVVYRIKYENLKKDLKVYDNDLKALYTLYKEETANNNTQELKDNLDVAIMEEE